VLAALAARVGQPVPVEVLIDEIWGEHPPPSARNSLQSHISRLRSAIGGDRIVRHDEAYEFRVGDDELDALAFRTICLHARASVARGQWDEAVASYDRALELWRGDAFEGFEDLPSCRGWASELAEQRIIALEERIEVQLERGHHTDAVAELESLTFAHPWRERLWRQWALALYRSDRQADALRVLDRFRRRLVDETGIEASDALRRLEARLLDQDDALQGPTILAPDAQIRQPLPPDLARLDASLLVGRESELALIAEAWKVAREGGTSCVMVAGEAGAGKTRIAAAVAARVIEEGGDVRYGRCTERLDLAYQPFANALRGIDTQLVGQLEASSASLTRLLPELASAETGPTEVPTDVASGRFLLYEAVAELVAELARPQGLLLVLDDLHWASPQGIRLLEHLVSTVRPPHLLLIGTFRDTDLSAEAELSELVDDLARRGDAARVSLTGLDVQQVGEVMRAHDLEVSDGDSLRIWRTTAVWYCVRHGP
jgi:DNA-binding SARP family transcriptional activator